MEEDDVGLGELLPRLFGYTNVVIFVKGSSNQTNLIVIDYLQ